LLCKLICKLRSRLSPFALQKEEEKELYSLTGVFEQEMPEDPEECADFVRAQGEKFMLRDVMATESDHNLPEDMVYHCQVTWAMAHKTIKDKYLVLWHAKKYKNDEWQTRSLMKKMSKHMMGAGAPATLALKDIVREREDYAIVDTTRGLGMLWAQTLWKPHADE
jgi:hypothetical protein